MDDETGSMQQLPIELQVPLRKGNTGSWRSFAKACAELAVEKTHVSNDLIRKVLGATFAEAQSLRDKVQAEADRYDNEAFDIRDAAEAGKGPMMKDYSTTFQKSRAVTALVAYLEDRPLDAAAWAAYEAMHALGGPEEGIDPLVALAKRWFA
jgi:hypothetical protein